MKSQIYILATIIFVIVMAACGTSSTGNSIEVQDPWIRAVGTSAGEASMGSGTMPANTEPMPPAGDMVGSTVAAFMSIKNNGPEPDKLIAINSDVAEALEIHLSEMKDDVMTMRQVDGVIVPAGGEVVLEPGGYHIMLIGLNRQLTAGEKVNLTLTFEKAGQLNIEAEVRPMP